MRTVSIAGVACFALLSGCVMDTTGRLTLAPDAEDVSIPDSLDMSESIHPDGPDVPPDLPVDPTSEDPTLDLPSETTDAEEEPDMPPCDGPMTIYYIDADGDGFGDIGGGVEWCAPPPGFVDNHDDCYDANPDAYPGQTAFFGVDRGDGNFDYDCDIAITLQYRQETSCDWGWCDGEGWTDGVPACGVSANWRRCDWWVVWCDVQNSSRQQLCR